MTAITLDGSTPTTVDLGATDSNDVRGGPESSEPLLPAPSLSSGDLSQLLATVMLEADFSRKKAARAERKAAEHGLAETQEAELSAMQVAADKKYDAAQIDAWTQIGAGIASGVGVGLSIGGTMNHNFALVKMDDLSKSFAEIGKGAGKLWSAGVGHEANDAEMTAKRSQNAAAVFKRIADECGDDEKAAKESARKVLDFVAEFQSTQSQSRHAAILRA